MKVSRLLISVFVISSLAFYACDDGNNPMSDSNTNPTDNNNDGDMNDDGSNNNGATLAPDFSLQNLNDETVTLSAYKGKVVVLFFFGNTCPSCIASAPSVQSKLANAYSANGNVIIVGIDQWDGTKASVEGFKNSTGVDFPLLLKGSSVASKFETTYDRLIVVDKEGYIRFKGSRGAGSDADSAKSTVETYLNK
ncbi:peroxiredoxin family protein [Saccharicrinis sp. GN24d3]|uniref:peroxiredoxin family protein n=1 Tax=Saccharicrinis sp. GN24d3 TaxID=3458416 RepID=UPI004035C67C